MNVNILLQQEIRSSISLDKLYDKRLSAMIMMLFMYLIFVEEARCMSI